MQPLTSAGATLGSSVDLGWGYARIIRGRILLEMGDYEAARESFKSRRPGRNPALKPIVDPVFEYFGDDAKLPTALAAIEQAMKVDSNFVPYFFYADMLLVDRFYDSSQRAIDEYDQFIFRDIWAPRLKSIRQDPRFVKLVTDAGLLDYWRTNGWPDKCEPAGDTFTCR